MRRLFWKKAEILAFTVRFVIKGNAEAFCERIHSIFLHGTERKLDALQLPLRETMEVVALILFFVRCLKKKKATGSVSNLLLYNTGVVACCKHVASILICKLQKFSKLYLTVADNAGVGCPTMLVLIQKMIHHNTLKILLEINDMKRDVE